MSPTDLAQQLIQKTGRVLAEALYAKSCQAELLSSKSLKVTYGQVVFWNKLALPPNLVGNLAEMKKIMSTMDVLYKTNLCTTVSTPSVEGRQCFGKLKKKIQISNKFLNLADSGLRWPCPLN